MRAIVLLLVVAMLGVSGCRKEPAARSKPKPPATGESHPQTSASTTTAAGAKPNEPPKPAIDRNAQVIVLGYHRFVEKVRRPDTEITPEDFEKQMQALKDDGIHVISLKQFLAWRRGDENIPPRSALITIDDGYASGHDIAWPILKKFGYPFSLFIYTDYVKGGPKSGGASMTWEQLAEMRDAGVSIQSHTVSHSDLRAKHHKGQDYEAWLWNELNGSKEMLEERLGIKVSALAVPYGRFDAHVQEIAAKAGYEMLFMVNGEKLGFDTPANALGRYMIQSNEPKIFASAVTFESRASSGGIVGSAAPGGALAIDTPLLEPEPPDSATITNERPLIRASLATLGEIEPGSVAMRLSGVGLLPAKFDPVARAVACQIVSPLEPDSYSVIVSAAVAGRKMEGRWKFTLSPPSHPAIAKGPP